MTSERSHANCFTLLINIIRAKFIIHVFGNFLHITGLVFSLNVFHIRLFWQIPNIV